MDKNTQCDKYHTNTYKLDDSHTPIPQRPYVKLKILKNRNPSVAIPLKKIKEDGDYPEEPDDMVITKTDLIMDTADKVKDFYRAFGMDIAVELGVTRIEIIITLMNPHTDLRKRNIQRKAFLRYVEQVIDWGSKAQGGYL